MVIAEGHHAIIIRTTRVGLVLTLCLDREVVSGKLPGAQGSAPGPF